MKRAVNVARAQGVEIERGIGQHGPGGNWFLVFKDPDGNNVEIYTHMEQIPADADHQPQTGRANSNRSTGTAWRISWCSRPPRYWRPGRQARARQEEHARIDGSAR